MLLRKAIAESSSFETRASPAPQDEVVFAPQDEVVPVPQDEVVHVLASL